MKNDFERKLFATIARQALIDGEAAWLGHALHSDMPLAGSIPAVIENGLGPLMYYHLRERQLLSFLPEKERKLLTRVYQETFLINSYFIRVLEDLGKALKQHHFKIMLLKGGSLLNTIYRDIALRPMEDIDIMVQPQHSQAFKRVLETKGFKPDPVYPDTFKKGILHLDIHEDFLSSHRIKTRNETMTIHLPDVWKRSVPIEEYGRGICRLSLYDHVLSLLFHLLKHRYRRLIEFVDLQEMIQGEAFEWQQMIKHCRQAGADRLMLYYLLLAKAALGTNTDREILEALGERDLNSVEKQLLRLVAAGNSPGTMTDLLWLYQIKNPIKKLFFICENLFPQKNVLQQIFPSSSISPGVLLNRFFKVLVRICHDFVFMIKSLTIKNLPRI